MDARMKTVEKTVRNDIVQTKIIIGRSEIYMILSLLYLLSTIYNSMLIIFEIQNFKFDNFRKRDILHIYENNTITSHRLSNFWLRISSSCMMQILVPNKLCRSATSQQKNPDTTVTRTLKIMCLTLLGYIWRRWRRCSIESSVCLLPTIAQDFYICSYKLTSTQKHMHLDVLNKFFFNKI